MYNREQKAEFIDYLFPSNVNNKSNDVRRNDWINLFNRLEVIEIDRDTPKDFAKFNYQEMMLSLPTILVKTVAYQQITLGSLRSYLDWAIQKGYSLDGENRLIGITPKDIDFSKSYNMNMVKDEGQLQKYLDIIFTPLNEDGKDNMYRTMLHLIFNGIPFDNVFDLKIDQFNKLDKTITLKGKEINLSDQCCSLIEYVNNMDYIYFSDSVKRREVIKNGYILENTSGDKEARKKSAISYVSLKFSELKKELKYPIAITFSSLLKSGDFYRIHQQEIISGEIDMKSDLNKDNTILEYKAWKKAFSL